MLKSQKIINILMTMDEKIFISKVSREGDTFKYYGRKKILLYSQKC